MNIVQHKANKVLVIERLIAASLWIIEVQEPLVTTTVMCDKKWKLMLFIAGLLTL
jgi:hypothetical protein